MFNTIFQWNFIEISGNLHPYLLQSWLLGLYIYRTHDTSTTNNASHPKELKSHCGQSYPLVPLGLMDFFSILWTLWLHDLVLMSNFYSYGGPNSVRDSSLIRLLSTKGIFLHSRCDVWCTSSIVSPSTSEI